MPFSLEPYLAKLEVRKSPSSFAPPGTHWSNRDLDPVPPKKRTWTMFNYFTYWLSDAFSIATWEIASTILAIGLSWRDAIPIILVGYFITMVFIVLNGLVGARLHVPFSVVNRSSMGFGLAYWSIFSRAVLACFWLGVQSANGGDCMTQMLRPVDPGYMANYRAYMHIINNDLVICENWGWSNIRATSGIAWIDPKLGMAAYRGFDPRVKQMLELGHRKLCDSGGEVRYMPPYQLLHQQETYCVRRKFVMLSHWLTNLGKILDGGLFWNPLQLIDHWDNRPAVFFAAFSFALATMGTNISANSLSAANDFSALFPRYVNIPRGSFLCAVIGGWLCVPWLVLADATSFLTFMSGYTVFIAPIIGIMASDYWILHRCKVDVPSMYQPHGRYWYTYGINWRALVAMLLTVPPMLPGLAQAITPSVLAGGTAHLYVSVLLYRDFLPYKDLVICTGVSKQLRDIIDASAVLEYILELGIAGLQDSSHILPDNNRRKHPTSDLLRALREREYAWSTLTCNSSWTIPVNKRYVVWELCGPIFAGCYLSGPTPPLHGIAFNMMEVYDLRDRKSRAPFCRLVLNKSFYNFSMDAGQDLLVMVEEVAPLAYVQSIEPASRLTNIHPSLVWKLHIRALSSGLPYNQVYPFTCSESRTRSKYHEPHVIHIPVAHEDWINENGYPGATDIQILGDAVLFAQRRGPSGSGSIAVVNWKTSQIRFITYPSCGDWCCTLLAQNELLVAGRANYRRAPLLEYYTLNDDNPHSKSYSSSTFMKWNSPRVVFELPFVKYSTSRASVRGTWRPAYCYTQASFTPKPFSPFVTACHSSSSPFYYPSTPQLIAIRFIDTSAIGPSLRSRKRTKVDMFIHIGQLRKLRNANDSKKTVESISSSITPVLWDDWGPATTRILNGILPKCWQRNIRGYRVVLPSGPPNSTDNNRGGMVLDFNSDLWDRSVDKVIWHPSSIILGEDTSEYPHNSIRKHNSSTIVTGLPYRQIIPSRYIAPYAQGETSRIGFDSNYVMLGDDVVCAEMDPVEFGALKAFRILHFGNP
ncbi:hypothetical protein Clacol_004690 [Clathrus columnatus]|uniref:Uncharacterized protein n=1 Tax=Clathrus columnatus TaxID=1419009 RepID=A0AAV5ACM3_9AGAM|nr:hypothetical protein Clacol_004690 [Clathrus columnatus]